jgi:uncharacterized protein YkwD
VNSITRAIRIKTVILLLTMVLSLTPTISTTFAESTIRLYLNNAPLTFDVAPQIINSRVLVPMRAIFEAFDAQVSWDGTTQTAFAVKNGLIIGLRVNHSYATVNGLPVKLDVPVTLVSGRILVPVRFISETLGATVTWQNTSRSVYIATSANLPPSSTSPYQPTPTSPNLSAQPIGVGDSLERILLLKGEPQRKDPSIYGFTWYIYNADYNQFAMIGVRNQRVVAVYAQTDLVLSQGSAAVGATPQQVRAVLGEPISGIMKGSTHYDYRSANIDLFYHQKRYTRVFYDQYSGGTMRAYLSVDAAEELNVKGYYGTPSPALKEAFEKQLLDLVNASRAKAGYKALLWAPEVVSSARAHSEDMVKNNYFSHTSPSGLTPDKRLSNAGVQFRSTAENLAAGQISSIFAHEALMNSQGHRSNIFSSLERLGVGVAFGGTYSQYFTETYYTPLNP